MVGQGPTTRAIASRLTASGWTVVFTCIPNTPHLRVAAIPISRGQQRYPDIVAVHEAITRILEVEVHLTEEVYHKTERRFWEYKKALEVDDNWRTWKRHVFSVTGCLLPQKFEPQFDLVLCRAPGPGRAQLVGRLEKAGIKVQLGSEFRP